MAATSLILLFMERMASAPTTLSHILGEDSELAQAVPGAERARAIRECVAKTIELERGPWTPHRDPASEDHYAAGPGPNRPGVERAPHPRSGAGVVRIGAQRRSTRTD